MRRSMNEEMYEATYLRFSQERGTVKDVDEFEAGFEEGWKRLQAQMDEIDDEMYGGN